MKEQKALTQLIRRVKGNSKASETLVLMGDANFNPSFGGGLTTPTIRIVNRLKRVFKVELIDEYNTSKLCSRCRHSLEGFSFPVVDGQNGSQGRIASYSVRHCKNQQCVRMVWDRDVNASINILMFGILGLKYHSSPGKFQGCRLAVLEPGNI